MREMKDSGVEWIGKISESFNVWKLKYLLSQPLLYGANESGESYTDNSVRYIRITDITNDNKLKDDENNQYLPMSKAIDYLLNDKDILLARSGATVGKSFIYYNQYGKSAFAGYLIKATCNPNLLLPDYFFYYTQSSLYDIWKNMIFIQATIQNIGANKYSNLEVTIPNIETQKRIVQSLDTQCSKVDTLIANQQSQIEKLKSYKQALITEVVTKGLDKNVPMKDSGVEWLGTFPAHWNYSPFGFVLKERNEKNNPVISEERLSLSIELGVTLYSEKTTNLDRFKDDFTQYKLTHKGDLVMNSMNMIVGATGVSEYFGCVSPAYYTFYDNTPDHITAKYCEFIFRSKTMLRVLHSMGKGIYSIDRGDDKINTCRLKVPKIDLKSLHIPVPPLNEQREIVVYLNNKLEQVDKLISVKLNKIEKLQQYKKSLIYEYVTGKKEVK